jgi:hypothetical protein
MDALYSRNLVMMSPAEAGDPSVQNGFLDPYPSVSREQFESLKAESGAQLNGLAFYVPTRVQVETPHGKRSLSIARTTADLFRLLNIPIERQNWGKPVLMLTSTAWRKYFNGDPHVSVLADDRWNLPGRVDGWLIEDETALGALPASTEGFVLARLRYGTLPNSRFRFVRLSDRSFQILLIVPMAFLFACVLLRIMPSDCIGGHLRRIGPRRGLFLAAKALLVLPILLFGSLDLTSLGGSLSPLFFDVVVFGSLFAVRWILADQRKRCPVCLRLLANPVRIGESSRILLEWHGTELMCLRGHGMLYVQEWPAIWSGQQRWMGLGTSWGGLFP